MREFPLIHATEVTALRMLHTFPSDFRIGKDALWVVGDSLVQHASHLIYFDTRKSVPCPLYGAQVLGSNTAAAEELFAGEPETALIASILWAFEVPSESFRLGRTRVFFRAGEISTLQKILNETPPEKGPWIFKRLQEALANRLKAKAAAERAIVSVVPEHRDV